MKRCSRLQKGIFLFSLLFLHDISFSFQGASSYTGRDDEQQKEELIYQRIASQASHFLSNHGPALTLAVISTLILIAITKDTLVKLLADKVTGSLGSSELSASVGMPLSLQSQADDTTSMSFEEIGPVPSAEAEEVQVAEKKSAERPHELVLKKETRSPLQVFSEKMLSSLGLDLPSFDQWAEVCDHMDKKIASSHLEIMMPHAYTQTALNSFDKTQDYLKLLGAFNLLHMAHKKNTPWVDDVYPTEKNPYYVEKIELPSDAVVALHGDFHGDVHSLNAVIKDLQKRGYMDEKDGFKIKDPNFYMVFLGDYTDRGRYGVEVIYTLMRLKLANPDKVFMVRGNHEDTEVTAQYGFQAELMKKFLLNFVPFEDGKKEEHKAYFMAISRMFAQMYDNLPVALYLGTEDDAGQKEFALCCHGGIEFGFDESPLMNSPYKRQCMSLGALKRNDLLKEYSSEVQNAIEGIDFYHNILAEKSEYQPADIGFLWNDFVVDDSVAPVGFSERGVGLQVGKKMLDQYLKLRENPGKHAIKAVFRAHQHSLSPTPMMKRILNMDGKGPMGERGVGKIWHRERYPKDPELLWPGVVATFLVAPVTPYSQAGFDYDAYGLLKLAPKFEEWKLEMVRQKILDGKK